MLSSGAARCLSSIFLSRVSTRSLVSLNNKSTISSDLTINNSWTILVNKPNTLLPCIRQFSILSNNKSLTSMTDRSEPLSLRINYLYQSSYSTVASPNAQGLSAQLQGLPSHVQTLLCGNWRSEEIKRFVEQECINVGSDMSKDLCRELQKLLRAEVKLFLELSSVKAVVAAFHNKFGINVHVNKVVFSNIAMGIYEIIRLTTPEDALEALCKFLQDPSKNQEEKYEDILSYIDIYFKYTFHPLILDTENPRFVSLYEPLPIDSNPGSTFNFVGRPDVIQTMTETVCGDAKVQSLFLAYGGPGIGKTRIGRDWQKIAFGQSSKYDDNKQIPHNLDAPSNQHKLQFLRNKNTIFLSVYISFGNDPTSSPSSSVTEAEFKPTSDVTRKDLEKWAERTARRVVNTRLLQRFYQTIDEHIIDKMKNKLVQSFVEKMDSSDLLHALCYGASKNYSAAIAKKDIWPSFGGGRSNRVSGSISSIGSVSSNAEFKFAVVVCIDEFQALFEMSKKLLPSRQYKDVESLCAVFKQATNELGSRLKNQHGLETLKSNNSSLPQLIAVYCCGRSGELVETIAHKNSATFRDFIKIPLTTFSYSETKQLLNHEVEERIREFLDEGTVSGTIHAFTGGVPSLLETTIHYLKKAPNFLEIERKVANKELRENQVRAKKRRILRNSIKYLLSKLYERYPHFNDILKDFELCKGTIAHGLISSKAGDVRIGEKNAYYLIDNGFISLANNSESSSSVRSSSSASSGVIRLPFVVLRAILDNHPPFRFPPLLAALDSSLDEHFALSRWEDLCARMVGVRAYCFKALGRTKITLGELFEATACGDDFKSQVVSLGPEWGHPIDLFQFIVRFPSTEFTKTPLYVKPGQMYKNTPNSPFESFCFFYKCDSAGNVTKELVLVAIQNKPPIGNEMTFSQQALDREYKKVLERKASLIAEYSRQTVTMVYLAVFTTYRSTVKDIPTNVGLFDIENNNPFFPRDLFSKPYLRILEDESRNQ